MRPCFFPRPSVTFLPAVVILLVAPRFISAQKDDAIVKIAAEESWSNVFAGNDVQVHLLVQSPAPFKGQLAWVYSVGKAVVVRREMPVSAGPGKPARVAVTLPKQEVREGVVLETKLSAAVFAEGGAAQGKLEKTIWLFPQDPFHDRRDWVKGLKITVYDPKGATIAVLKKTGLTFEEAGNAEALGELKEGLVLIGEGVSFREDRGLPEILVKAGAAGLPVLCLAPVDGSMSLGPGKIPAAAAGLSFQRQHVITRLDKRLDAEAWTGKGKVVASGLTLKGEGEDVVGEVGVNGWPWTEMNFADGGRLVVCGFGMIQHWESGPTPRFLFARMLEHMVEKKKQEAAEPKAP